MTPEAKKAKIIAAIKARGWFTAELYLAEAKELRSAGAIKLETRRTSVGGIKSVWVEA